MVRDSRTISAAAFLISDHCQDIGRRWETQGVHAAARQAIEDDARRPVQVVAAGVAAAADVNAKTPAALRWEQYYPDPDTGDLPELPRCEICNKTETACRALAAKTGDPHQFTLDRRQP